MKNTLFISVFLLHTFIISLVIIIIFHRKSSETIPAENIPVRCFSFEEALNATVKIKSIYTTDALEITRKGTGTIISQNGYILTNYHNIGEAQFIQITLYDGRMFIAHSQHVDANQDLALLKIQSKELNLFSVGNTEDMQLGDQVFAIGNPAHLEYSLTSGVISGFNRKIRGIQALVGYSHFIQTDVPINPGCSGGPLFNKEGDLIGLITAIWSKSGRFEGYSFAIPTQIIQEFIKEARINIEAV